MNEYAVTFYTKGEPIGDAKVKADNRVEAVAKANAELADVVDRADDFDVVEVLAPESSQR